MAPVLARPRKTVEDLHALPEGVLAELIDGEIYVNPTPRANHQTAVVLLAHHLLLHLRHGLEGRLFVAPFDVHLPSGDVVEPDLLWVSPARLGIVRGWVYGAPDLVVETLSPSNPERDLLVKRALYAKNEVPEYWIVDPPARGVQVLRLARGVYEPAGWFTSGSSLVSPTFPGLAIPVDALFPDVPPPT